MIKIHIKLPADLYNRLFRYSVKSGKAIALIAREALTERLLATRAPRAANDN